MAEDEILGKYVEQLEEDNKRLKDELKNKKTALIDFSIIKYIFKTAREGHYDGELAFGLWLMAAVALIFSAVLT